MSLRCDIGRIKPHHGVSERDPAFARPCLLRRTLGTAEQPAGRRAMMWPLTSMTKKQRHLFGLAASSQSGDKGMPGSHSPLRRDDSIVITASGVAPLLPSSGSGSITQPSGASLHHHPHLHHLSHGHVHAHAHGSSSSGCGHGGATGGGAGPGAGSLSGCSPATAPMGLPYQRPNASAGGQLTLGSIGAHLSTPFAATTATTAAASSVDEVMARSVALSPTRRGQLCDEGLPDPDMCAFPGGELDLDLDLNGVDRRPATAATAQPAASSSTSSPVIDEAFSRGRWLLGLLIVQSTSSFVLDAYQDLLRDHLVVTLFLTMLVGAGGNAGNQSAIKVIRGLATGAIRPSWPSARATIREQALVGLLLGTGLSAGGFVRVYATHGDVANAAAISISLFLIVMTSVVLGTGLPFALARAGVDPANAGTSIQVLMDILGVTITCVTCHFMLVQLALGVGAAVAS